MAKRRKRTPHEKIYLAWKAHTGCRLTPEDVSKLGQDEAIMFRGEKDFKDTPDDPDPRRIPFEEPRHDLRETEDEVNARLEKLRRYSIEEDIARSSISSPMG